MEAAAARPSVVHKNGAIATILPGNSRSFSTASFHIFATVST